MFKQRLDRIMEQLLSALRLPAFAPGSGVLALLSIVAVP